MARQVNRLTAAGVAKISTRGMHPDGDGLYLQVSNGGAKSWIYRYSLNGRSREMGFGPARVVGLKAAREKAARARRLRYDGVDPIDARRVERARLSQPVSRAPTFRTAANAYIAAHEAGWRNAKHRYQWRATLSTYAEPFVGTVPVDRIATPDILKILEPIWAVKPETATRVRARVEAVLDWAAARGHRKGENPARWKGHLDKLLPASGKLRRVTHYAALPYGQIADFMRKTQARPGTAASALKFLILTACRTGEVLGARWSEIDLAAKLWVVPGGRMKAHKEHRVPLSGEAVRLLEVQRKLALGEFVFPRKGRDKPLSNMAILMLMRRMGRGDLTAHGFRSTFRDWVAEQTEASHQVAEMALAHSIGNAVEAAYRRGDLLEKRTVLMEAWARYCTEESSSFDP